MQHDLHFDAANQPEHLYPLRLVLNQKIVSKLNDDMPVYHTRTMRQEFVYHYGYFMKGTKPYELRTVYCELTKDCSTSRTFDEQQVDDRIKEEDKES